MATIHLQPLTVLGKGTFGKVILALETEPNARNKLVAVKLLNKSRVLHISKRVATELRVLTEVAPSCRHLVSCREAYQTDDVVAYVLDYSSGGDLRALMRKTPCFALSEVVHYAKQIIEGLAHLHKHCVLYRDLKPQNILLGAGPSSALKLADFGLSKFLGDDSLSAASGGCLVALQARAGLLRTRTSCGTPAYQAPEMVLGQPYGLEADWWAFGVVLYEMLVGKMPFPGNTVPEVHNLIVNQPPKFPDTLPTQTVGLLRSLLCKKRSKRLGTGTPAQVLIKLKRSALFCESDNRGLSNPDLSNAKLNSMCSFEADIFSTPYEAEPAVPSIKHFDIPGFKVLPNTAFDKFVRCDSVRCGSSTDSVAMTSESLALS